MTIAATVIQSVLAVMFLFSGATKLMGMQMHVDSFNSWGYPQWFRSVTGATEIIGAVGMLVGIWVTPVAAAAGVWLAAIMSGAVYTDVFRGDKPAKAIPAAVLLAGSVAVVALAAAA